MKKIFDFVDLFKKHKEDPNDTELENRVNSFDPHPIPKHGVNAVWIMQNLRLWYYMKGDELVLDNLENHDGYKKKR